MMFFGVILIILGVLLFLQKFGIITQGIWEFFWPTILIAIGAVMLWMKSK